MGSARPEPHRALLPVLGAVALVEVVLLVLWGARTPIFDEAGYLKTSAAVARWAHEGGDPVVLGRLAWHNPGYSILGAVFAMLGDAGGIGLRLLQSTATLHAGWMVHTLLGRRVGPAVALGGAAIIWLHPSIRFFALTLWPAALTLWLLTGATLALDDFQRRPSSTGAGRLGLWIAPLPFFAPQSLALLPLVTAVAWRLHRKAVPRILGPVLALWLPWALAASAALQMPTVMDFASRETLAIGNHPDLPAGRGSSFDHAASLRPLRSSVKQACRGLEQAAEVRCEAHNYEEIARKTISDDPSAALARVALRVVEAWSPDRFVVRHLHDPRAFPAGPPLGTSAVRAVGLGFHVLALIALGLLLVNGRRRRDVALLAAAVALWTLGPASTVGATRLMVPALPWIVVGGLSSLYPSRTSRRRTHGDVSG